MNILKLFFASSIVAIVICCNAIQAQYVNEFDTTYTSATVRTNSVNVLLDSKNNVYHFFGSQVAGEQYKMYLNKYSYDGNLLNSEELKHSSSRLIIDNDEIFMHRTQGSNHILYNMNQENTQIKDSLFSFDRFFGLYLSVKGFLKVEQDFVFYGGAIGSSSASIYRPFILRIRPNGELVWMKTDFHTGQLNNNSRFTDNVEIYQQKLVAHTDIAPCIHIFDVETGDELINIESFVTFDVFGKKVDVFNIHNDALYYSTNESGGPNIRHSKFYRMDLDTYSNKIIDSISTGSASSWVSNWYSKDDVHYITNRTDIFKVVDSLGIIETHTYENLLSVDHMFFNNNNLWAFSRRGTDRQLTIYDEDLNVLEKIEESDAYEFTAVAYNPQKCYAFVGHKYPVVNFGNAEIKIFYTETASTTNPLQSTDFKLYPNPTSSLLTISFPLTTSEPLSMSFVSLEGKVIQTQTIPSNTTNYTLNVEGMKKGIYLVRIGDTVKKVLVD